MSNLNIKDSVENKQNQIQIQVKENKKPSEKSKNFNKKSEKLVIAKAYWVK